MTARRRRHYEPPAPRGPFEGAQFLIEPARSSRRQIDNDHGDPVLLVVCAAPPLGLLPQRLAAFYDLHSGERLLELRPEPGARKAAHRLIDAEGTLIARFELDLAAARWACSDADGKPHASATAHPRSAAWAALGRGRWVRTVLLTTEGVVAGVVARGSPEFDGHDLVDLSHDAEARLDRRLALAMALLAS
jgi:hypothetical protein